MVEKERQTISRRAFTKGVAGMAAGLFLAEQNPSNQVQASFDKDPNPSTISQVKEFDATIGENPLTFEDTQQYNALLADLYVQSTGSPRSAKDILATSYVVQKVAPDKNADSADGATINLNDGKKFQSVLLAELCMTYPDLTLTSLSAQAVLNAAYPTSFETVGGLTVNHDVFMFLDNINTPPQPPKISPRPPLYQFSDLARRTGCRESSSVTKYRSVKFHEDGHAGILRDVKIDDSVHIHGFNVIEETGTDTYKSYPELEELFADFNGAEVSNQHDLDYTTGYAYNPSDYTNFMELLRTISLTPQDLRNLHTYSGLQGLLSRMQTSPVIQELTPSTQEIVYGGLQAAFLIPSPEEGPNWDRIAHYFPNVDAKSYIYEPRLPADLPDQGCIFPGVTAQE